MSRPIVRVGVTTTAVLALTLAGVVLPTVTLPVPHAHAVSPEVDEVLVRGVDPDARRQRGALDEAVGHTRAEADHDSGELAALSERTTTQDFLVAGVTWDASSAVDVTEVAVRLRESGKWTAWQSLGLDGITMSGGRAGTEPIVTTGADGVQARVRTASGAPPKGLQVDVVDPGTSRADAYIGSDATPAATASAGTGFEIRPWVVTRKSWGADESLAGSWPEVSGKLKAIYIHHTAGTNSYRESQSAAIVRGIYAYHVKSRGWADIGYQFLVDKYGNIFEGRKSSKFDNPIGAQAGGYNTGTIGISAMGSFDTARPTSALVTAITKVVAWKSYQYGINPKGSTTLVTGGSTGSGTRAKPGSEVRVPTVLMHRTTNETACPGQYLAAKMSTIRSSADSRRRSAISKYGSLRAAVKPPVRVTPTSAQSPVQWNSSTTYKWNRVSGARTYQVLQRYARWNADMPYTYYWRVVKTTTSTSITLSQGNGMARQLAVRALDRNWVRGPLANLVKTSRPVETASWAISSSWKKISGSSYWGGYVYRTTTKDATIKLRGAHQVRRVVIRGATSPDGGRLKVAVGSTTYKVLDFGAATDNDRIFTVTLPALKNGTVTLKAVDSGKPVRISKIALARW